LIEITETASQGVFINQVILDKLPSAPYINNDLFTIESLDFCAKIEQ
jgi:hypothetical protein